MAAHAIALLEHDEHSALTRWCVAALLVVAVHFGLAASYILWAPPPPQAAPAAPAVIIELALLPVAPASPVDLAPGPEMTEAQSPPEPIPQSAPPEVTEPLPKIEGPAEVLLPMPEPKTMEPPVEQKVVEPRPPEPKPVEKPPDVKRPEPRKVERNPPAPRTTASPRAQHRTAPVARAPSPGSAQSNAALASWRDRVLAHLQRNKRYPNGAESRREQGVVTLSFGLDRRGRVLSRHIVRSSGHPELDSEVMAMIQRAQPLPAFPPEMTQSSVQLVVPIRFSLR
jgi:periplasmic protein TonB